MAGTLRSIAYLEGKFETGDVPTQQDFYDLFASFAHLNAPITGATKAKITYDASGLITGGTDLIASDIPSLDAAKITTGTFDIARIPAAALERVYIYTGSATLPESAGLTTGNVQNGDVVKMNTNGTTPNGLMYVVADETNLTSSASFVVYNAGTAAAVPWSGVTSKPSTFSGYGFSNGNGSTMNGLSYDVGGTVTNDIALNGLTLYNLYLEQWALISLTAYDGVNSSSLGFFPTEFTMSCTDSIHTSSFTVGPASLVIHSSALFNLEGGEMFVSTTDNIDLDSPFINITAADRLVMMASITGASMAYANGSDLSAIITSPGNSVWQVTDATNNTYLTLTSIDLTVQTLDVTFNVGDVPGILYSTIHFGEDWHFTNFNGTAQLDVYPDLALQQGLVSSWADSSGIYSVPNVCFTAYAASTGFQVGGGVSFQLTNQYDTEEKTLYLINEFIDDTLGASKIRFSIKNKLSGGGLDTLFAIREDNDLEVQVFGPLKLKSYATGSLPAAANHTDCIVRDSTTNTIKKSNGSTWS